MIQVRLTDAGRTNIQVIDNGKGMSETDARMAFERHATSKIKEAADLFALYTFGFRGEALPSIAAVAQVELRTRREVDDLGTVIHIAGSKLESQEADMCPVGTNFQVKNLFFNVPARRKFLKSNQTELNNVITEIERIALVNPDIAFSLYHNEVELINVSQATMRQETRARALNYRGRHHACQHKGLCGGSRKRTQERSKLLFLCQRAIYATPLFS